MTPLLSWDPPLREQMARYDEDCKSLAKKGQAHLQGRVESFERTICNARETNRATPRIKRTIDEALAKAQDEWCKRKRGSLVEAEKVVALIEAADATIAELKDRRLRAEFHCWSLYAGAVPSEAAEAAETLTENQMYQILAMMGELEAYPIDRDYYLSQLAPGWKERLQ